MEWYVIGNSFQVLMERRVFDLCFCNDAGVNECIFYVWKIWRVIQWLSTIGNALIFRSASKMFLRVMGSNTFDGSFWLKIKKFWMFQTVNEAFMQCFRATKIVTNRERELKIGNECYIPCITQKRRLLEGNSCMCENWAHKIVFEENYPISFPQRLRPNTKIALDKKAA